MSTFTLDAIRQAADAKYGSTDIDLGDGTTVVLRNPLRLSKEERVELASLQSNLDTEDEGVDQADVLADAIRLVAKDKRPVEKLIKQVDGDLAVLAEIFESYSRGTQVGEASASAA